MITRKRSARSGFPQLSTVCSGTSSRPIDIKRCKWNRCRKKLATNIANAANEAAIRVKSPEAIKKPPANSVSAKHQAKNPGMGNPNRAMLSSRLVGSSQTS